MVSLVAVLVLHGIGSPGPYTISPQTFAAELRTLHEDGVSVLTLAQFEAYVNGTLQITRPSVLITFDDGNASDYAATPILQEFQDPATAFLIGARIGSDPSTLTPSEISAMAQTGLWTFGSHTYNLHSPYAGADATHNLHYYVANGLSLAPVLTHDMAQESGLFTSLGLSQPNAFAFPFGFYTPAIIALLHPQYPFLFTSHTGFAQPGAYLIPRINIGSDYASLATLQEAISMMQHLSGSAGGSAPETRAQFVWQLVQALGIPRATPAAPTFADVSKKSPDYRYIEGAYAAGIVSGVTPGHFDPNAPITRAQAAKILVEAYEGGNYVPTLTATAFSDNSAIPAALVGYVAEAAQLQLMRGLPGNRFDPGAYLTAAEESHLMAQVDAAVASGAYPARGLKSPSQATGN